MFGGSSHGKVGRRHSLLDAGSHGVCDGVGSSETQEKRIRSYLKEQWKLLPKDF